MSKKEQSLERVFTSHLSRRRFLQALAVSGALAALPGGLLATRAGRVVGDPIDFGAQIRGGYGGDIYETFRNACPRNCFDTCSIKSYVKDGVLAVHRGR